MDVAMVIHHKYIEGHQWQFSNAIQRRRLSFDLLCPCASEFRNAAPN